MRADLADHEPHGVDTQRGNPSASMLHLVQRLPTTSVCSSARCRHFRFAQLSHRTPRGWPAAEVFDSVFMFPSTRFV